MAEVEVSGNAAADLDSIYEFGTSRFGERVAMTYQARIEAVFERLERFPSIGPVDPTFELETHYVNVGSHRVYYERQGDKVVVLRILHQAMLPQGRVRG